MEATVAEKTKIRYWSDGELYQRAVQLVADFLADHPAVDNSQMHGLWEFSGSWEYLSRFVTSQRGRNWGELGRSKRGHYTVFYNILDRHLGELRKKATDEFVPDGLTKKENKAATDFYAILVAQEFVQHLAIEMLYQESIRRRNES